VMEFVEGMNLADRFHLGLKLEQSLMCIRQVLSALEYAHSRGVVHRDLKPANIMITDSGGVKLLDFGLALVSTPDPRLTSSGSLLGSVHYISPEQIRGETLDARSDLYSLGTTLYELVTGRLPVQGDSFPEIISGHLEAKYPAPSVVNTAIPKKLSDVVMRAMARERSQRFQSAAEFASALEHAMVDSTPGWRVTMRTESVAPHSHTTHLLAPTLMPKQAKNYDAAVLEDISAQLANYIGPIAKVIVRRASSSSNNLRELCDKVAKEIDSEHSRSRFLQSVRKHLRAS
jgi:eukaryotic-like serine/threonine-protein kinase